MNGLSGDHEGPGSAALTSQFVAFFLRKIQIVEPSTGARRVVETRGVSTSTTEAPEILLRRDPLLRRMEERADRFFLFLLWR
jgi:hypothetical protein